MHRMWIWSTLCAVTCLTVALTGCSGKKEAAPDSADSQQATDPTATAVGASASTGQSLAGDPEKPVITIDTSMGRIVVQLDRQRAPQTVDAFRRHVQIGHYDGTIFHQVYEDQVILGGGFRPDLQEKLTSGTLANEANNGLKNTRGTLAMYRLPDIKDSASTIFFINLKDNPIFDHQDQTDAGFGYCVFGTVIDGLDVADRIGKVPVTSHDGFDSLPVQNVTINSMRVTR